MISLIAVLFALLATLCGAAVNRAFRAPASLAPLSGLAAIAVLTTWCTRLELPAALSTAGIVVLALVGAVVASRAFRTQAIDRVAIATLAAAVVLPAILLGWAMVGVDAPVSTHDGAFHVETIETLRRGVPVQGWYPMGFHTSIAAVLRLVPWVDTARGTTEASQALAILAPAGVFALGLALRLDLRVASLGALIVSLTYIYPYDNQMWGGWPLSMSILLLLGLWSAAARWIARPSAGLAAVGGLLAGALVLTHGTEVYSALLGLAVIAALRWRDIRPGELVRHLPLAAAAAVLGTAPYLTALLGWAAGGGATAAGAGMLEGTVAGQGSATSNDGLEFILGVTGAAGFIDLPLRIVLLVIGARTLRVRTPLIGWLVFGAVLFVISFIDIPPVRALYVVTFPWLVHHRPPQMVVLFTSLLVGGGLAASIAWLSRLREKFSSLAWRRVAIVSAAFLLFFAEGSAVSIFKTLDQVIGEQNVYSADDRAAMTWLQAHAARDEIVINDAASDAGIWAPYKAGVPILLPRSAAASDRGQILLHVADLERSSALADLACGLHADYVYQGSRAAPDDTPLLPDRATLEHAPGLEKVFASGDATVFRLRLPCN